MASKKRTAVAELDGGRRPQVKGGVGQFCRADLGYLCQAPRGVYGVLGTYNCLRPDDVPLGQWSGSAGCSPPPYGLPTIHSDCGFRRNTVAGAKGWCYRHVNYGLARQPLPWVVNKPSTRIVRPSAFPRSNSGRPLYPGRSRRGLSIRRGASLWDPRTRLGGLEHSSRPWQPRR
jgi:hypothetical protein